MSSPYGSSSRPARVALPSRQSEPVGVHVCVCVGGGGGGGGGARNAIIVSRTGVLSQTVAMCFPFHTDHIRTLQLYMMATSPNSQQQQRKLKMESPMWSGGSLKLYEYCTTAHGWVTT